VDNPTYHCRDVRRAVTPSDAKADDKPEEGPSNAPKDIDPRIDGSSTRSELL
jgi:hypothetical protein